MYMLLSQDNFNCLVFSYEVFILSQGILLNLVNHQNELFILFTQFILGDHLAQFIFWHITDSWCNLFHFNLISGWRLFRLFWFWLAFCSNRFNMNCWLFNWISFYRYSTSVPLSKEVLVLNYASFFNCFRSSISFRLGLGRYLLLFYKGINFLWLNLLFSSWRTLRK